MRCSRRQLGALALGLLLATAAQAEPLRRFALIIGNDEGGSDTRPLSYAREDARKMHGAPGAAGRRGSLGLEAAAERGRARTCCPRWPSWRPAVQAARKSGERTALLVYYSGHAKDGSLRLGDSRLPFDTSRSGWRMRPRTSASPSWTRAARERSRGPRAPGAHRPSTIDSGATRDARGLVILTSSSADEDSQESDVIGGSYFSHHLASGLLGDADRSGDGQVTLFEAYSHAYARTVADTAASSAGPQHPTFSYDLAGNGDLVLTSLRASEGLVVPSRAPDGRLLLRESERAGGGGAGEGAGHGAASGPGSGHVPGKAPAGGSAAHRRGGGSARAGDGAGGVRLRDAPFSDDPVKGGRGRGSFWTVGLTGGYHSFFDADTRESLFLSVPLLGGEANLHNYFREDWVWSFDVALGGRACEAEPGQPVGRALPLLGAQPGHVAHHRVARGGPVSVRSARGSRTSTWAASSTARAFPDQFYATFSPGFGGGPALSAVPQPRTSPGAAGCTTSPITSKKQAPTTATAPWATGSWRPW